MSEERFTETPAPMSAEEQREYQARQKSRSIIMGLILAGLCLLFFLITLVKIGGS